MNELPERLPSRPLRNWFLAWHIHTGDPAEVIAKGFDLEPVLVTDLLTGEVPLMIRTDEAVHICLRIRASPTSFWQLPQVGDGPELATSDPWSGIPWAIRSCLAVATVAQSHW